MNVSKDITVRESGIVILNSLIVCCCFNDHTHALYLCSAIALTKLFLSGDPRVLNVQVQGDLIVTNTNSMYLIYWFYILFG